MKKSLLFLLVLSVFLTEIILGVNEIAGFIFYVFLITGVLLSISKAEFLDNHGKLALIFMILPTLRIVELFLEIGFFWETLIFYYLLLFLVTFCSLKFKINPSYNKKNLILLPLVVLLSIFLGCFGNIFLNLDKYTGFVAIIPIIAFSEEVLFRGMIQNLIEKEHCSFVSVLIPALLYGIFSLSYGFSAIIFFCITAFIISLVYHLTKNIFLTITANLIIHLFILV